MSWSLMAANLCGQYLASSHPRFFLTYQIIFKSKIEKQNVSLKIFVSGDTSS